ncbi:hypothetical protein CLCR_00860 [Cladophialophora carrionii]|uniref:Rhodopsin domain-containing protein n=1 Tax=Cladophialophora carrionii TaxID=86049 RepID=A0A1C1D0P9_9EURO|nr:hypothetical protein CLCR_00860 [Cladophialophora carrionii]
MSSTQNYVTEKQLVGVGYAMIAITSIVFGARTLIRVNQPKRFQADDLFLLLAYLCFLTLSILYIVLAPTMYRITDASSGLTPIYPEILSDSLFMIKIFFANTMIFWFALYAVKFSFLSLYRRLMKGLRLYMQLWWAVVAFCVLTLIGCVISNFTSCHSMHAWFTPGECSERRDVRAQIASLYYAYAVDVISDLFIMFLPLRLIWNLQRPTAQKVGIGGLFCVGWVCITFATIRVVQIGVKANNSSTPSSSWLALWAIVESAVTVIVGCCPGLYSKAKEVHSTRKTSSKRSGLPQNYYHGSRGYEKQGTGAEDDGKMDFETMVSGNGRSYHAVTTGGTHQSIEMKNMPIKAASSQSTQRGEGTNGTFWEGDETSSQEELNGHKHIYVTNSIEIKDEDESIRESSRKDVDFAKSVV